jgi:hypothetical protein
LGVRHAVGARVRLGLRAPVGVALRVAEDRLAEDHERLVGRVKVDVPARLVEDRGERVGQRGRGVVRDLEEQQRPARRDAAGELLVGDVVRLDALDLVHRDRHPVERRAGPDALSDQRAGRHPRHPNSLSGRCSPPSSGATRSPTG